MPLLIILLALLVACDRSEVSETPLSSTPRLTAAGTYFPPPGEALSNQDRREPHEVGLDDRIEADLGPVEVLALPHHGSRTSTGSALLTQVRPLAVIAQVGRRNRYGHPDPQVVGRALASGATVLRTDVHGTVGVDLSSAPRFGVWGGGVGWRPFDPRGTGSATAPPR